MKPVRKRAIIKTMKVNAIKLLNEYGHHEHAMIVAGVRTISDEREMLILNTLSSYAHILDRNFKANSKVYEEDWALYVTDHY